MADRAPPPSFTIESRAGRLIEARVHRLRSPEDALAYARALGAQVARVPANARPILVADHRPVLIYTQPVADQLGVLFREMNARLDRVAILVARSNATLLLQLDRLAREAAFANRKVFLETDGAIEHVAPVLDPTELARARAFLAEHVG